MDDPERGAAADNDTMKTTRTNIAEPIDAARTVLRRITSLIGSGSERTARAKKNILMLGVMKTLSIAAGLVQVPLILGYLNATGYGVWLTLSSIVAWIVYFDVGLGNGLRNKFAEAMAVGDVQLAKIYVSTTYFLVSLIVGAVLLVFFCANPFLDWRRILGAPSFPLSDLSAIAVVVFTFFSLRFVFSLIGTILAADQEPGKAGMIEVAVNLLSLAAIYTLTKMTASSLFSFALVQSGITVLVPAAASVWFFGGRYRNVAPSFRFIRMKHAAPLANLGLQFFAIQIAGLLIFSTSNILIANMIGPAEVTAYNIAFKYFSVVTMIFGVVLAPFWSAFTEAFLKDEIAWITLSIRKLIIMWALAALATAVMLAASGPVYHLWVGGKAVVPFSLSLAMAVYITISNWNSIFVSFLNGTGRIRLQLYSAVSVGLMNIPLAYVLVKYAHWGIAGVVSASAICLFVGSIWAPIQYKKLITKTATGIWAK